MINSGVALEHSDIPEDFPAREELYPTSETWINPGDSAVIAPGGEIVAGPLHKTKGLLYTEVDPTTVPLAKRALDVAGHYARPDIFHLEVNSSAVNLVSFVGRNGA